MAGLMRLLRCSDSSNYGLPEAFPSGTTIPPYAILSHTWIDGQEITFRDLMDGIGKEKTGYQKIKLCAQQAKRDGLQYFWVDTCCINKSNPAELQKAINSMFRYYRDAERCYVYLQDVSVKKRKASDSALECAWEPAFRQSRWFRRGWTLQELLAPTTVEFFSQEWKKLGDKQSLVRQIHEVTGIPNTALQGAPMFQFSSKERSSWIQSRETGVREDKAYALLGIFDVEMTLCYGEGYARAFERLQEEISKLHACLQDLRSTDPRDDKKRIEDTKGGLLLDSYCWIFDNPDFQRWHDSQQWNQLLWIKGDPGKGKTMLLCGIINELSKSVAKTALLSYFFCQATDSRINHATAVLRGLIYLLVHQQPSLVKHIYKKYDNAGHTIFEDANAWVTLSEIFTDIMQDTSVKSMYLIIDALDECVTDLPKLLDLIVKTFSTSSRVKWIVSSRNWPDIEERLVRAGDKVRLSLELNAESVSVAVRSYITQRVSRLAQDKKYSDETERAVLDYLYANANDTFLWAALVCQNLDKMSRFNIITKLKTFPAGLKSLYERMLQCIDGLDDADLCRRVLATVAVVYQPIRLQELTSLVEELDSMTEDLDAVQEVVNLCGSLLTVRDGIVYFLHQSAKDYLLKEAYTVIFPSGSEVFHHILFSRSILVMSKVLRRDMYGLIALGYPIEEVQQPEPNPLAASRYSCIYWIDHLCDWSTCAPAHPKEVLQSEDTVDKFLRKSYIYWLEALSLFKSMSKGAVSIAKLEALTDDKAASSPLVEVVRDARRFMMYHKSSIESSPLQVYASALLFSPSCSLIRSLFNKEAPKGIVIKPDMQDQWGDCLLTLECHSQVFSVAFSHDSTRLASALDNSTIQIWEVSSGSLLRLLEGHSDLVDFVAFSYDSTQLASVSRDGTVKLWDASTGEHLQTLKSHRGDFRTIAFSLDSAMLASASLDGTVKIWDASSGACLRTFESDRYSSDGSQLPSTHRVSTVAFSRECKWLASVSGDGSIKIWDTSSFACVQTFESHGAAVTSVSFSHDSTRLALVFGHTIVKIWSISNGECLRIPRDSAFVHSMTFSHDSTWLAIADFTGQVEIWDARSRSFMRMFQSHREIACHVAFSHDSVLLASASYDGTIQIWDATSITSPQMLKGQSSSVRLVAFSHDSAQLASVSDSGKVKIWNVSNGDCLQTLPAVYPLPAPTLSFVAFAPNSLQLACVHRISVTVWDLRSGKCLSTLEGHNEDFVSVAFSHNSTRLASASKDGTVKIWDPSSSSSASLLTLEGHSNAVNSVAFSRDSTQLASASKDGTVRVWDTRSGECKSTLKVHGDRSVFFVAFSYDSTRLASMSGPGIPVIKLWDIRTADCIHTLICDVPECISFDTSGLYLHTDNGVIDTTDLSISNTASTDQEPPILKIKGVASNHISCSDKTWITYVSEKLLWLPWERRPICSAVSGDVLAIGTENGLVWFCKVQSR